MAIHRFKFSSELNEEIQAFSNKHMFDNAETLIENFEEWYTKMEDLIHRENEFLVRHHYELPIKQKVFKSIKYYYVKKFKENEQNEPKKRTGFNKIPKEIMDSIKEDLIYQFNKDVNFKPSETYEAFKKEDNPLIKKSYKNQYYQMKNKLYNNNVNGKE